MLNWQHWARVWSSYVHILLLRLKMIHFLIQFVNGRQYKLLDCRSLVLMASTGILIKETLVAWNTPSQNYVFFSRVHTWLLLLTMQKSGRKFRRESRRVFTNSATNKLHISFFSHFHVSCMQYFFFVIIIVSSVIFLLCLFFCFLFCWHCFFFTSWFWQRECKENIAPHRKLGENLWLIMEHALTCRCLQHVPYILSVVVFCWVFLFISLRFWFSLSTFSLAFIFSKIFTTKHRVFHFHDGHTTTTTKTTVTTLGNWLTDCQRTNTHTHTGTQHDVDRKLRHEHDIDYGLYEPFVCHKTCG